MRKTKFTVGEFYHIYNRGVDKRSIFENEEDFLRFYQSIQEFNTIENSGSLFEILRTKNQSRSSTPKSTKLVNFIAYCLNQNHFHFILEPLVEDGIQKFMHKLSTGYTNYFNDSHERSGALFQGRYKSIHIDTNEYLLHLSVYINLNNFIHKGLNKLWFKKFPFSSFPIFIDSLKTSKFCNPKIILDQFSSTKEYHLYAKEIFSGIVSRKETNKELKKLFFDPI